MTPDQEIAFLEQKVVELGEHFDHVQVLVSWNEQALTHSLKRGAGNWHARQGLAHEFIGEDMAQNNAVAVSRYLPPSEPPDGGEEWKHA